MSGEWNAPIAMLQVHDGHLNVVFLVWRDRARTVHTFEDVAYSLEKRSYKVSLAAVQRDERV